MQLPGLRAVLTLCLLFSTGCEARPGKGAPSAENEKGGPRGSGAIPVRTTKARRGSIGRILEFSGTVQARHLWEIHAQVPGSISKLHVERGDEVSPTMPLLVLNDPDLHRRRVEQVTLGKESKQNVQKAQLRLSEVKAQIQESELDEKDLIQQQRTLAARSRQAKKRYQDKLVLHRQELISDSDFQQIQLDRDTAQNDFEGVESRLLKTRLGLDRLKQIDRVRAEIELQLARLSLERHSRSLAQIDEDIEQLTIRAPVAGLILSENLRLGARVSKGQALLTLVPLTSLVLRLRVPEGDALVLKPGLAARMTSDSFDSLRPASSPDSPIAGQVDRVLPLVDEESGTVEVVIAIHQGTKIVRPGMLLRCQVQVDQRPKAILVLRRALLYEQEKPFLFVVDDENLARRTFVEIGFSRDQDVEILSGLEAGHHVIIVGQKTLRDGAAVRVVSD